MPRGENTRRRKIGLKLVICYIRIYKCIFTPLEWRTIFTKPLNHITENGKEKNEKENFEIGWTGGGVKI